MAISPESPKLCGNRHTSTTGVNLHPDLASVKQLVEGKWANHIKALYLQGKENTIPVFITQEEEKRLTSVEKKHIAQI